MSLTAKDIAEITRLLEDSSFDELELEIDGLKIHLRAQRRTARAGTADSPRSQPAAAARSRQSPARRAAGRAPWRAILTWSRCARLC